MRVLWLCNIVLPDFSQEFGIKRRNVGGWMTGMLHALEKREDVEVGLCFPIYDVDRLKDGEINNHKYFSFHSYDTYDEKTIDRFKYVLTAFRPDIVHIWGTEYSHTTAMLHACNNLEIINRAVVNIQGLISNYSSHYRADIPERYWKKKYIEGRSLVGEYDLFKKNEIFETESIGLAKHVIGRTDWDKACVEKINPDIHYYFCDEILREAFYDHIQEWDYSKCQKHSIFVSQATYPIKGFHYLLQALPDIIRRYPDTHIYVSGDDVISKSDRSPYGCYLKDMMQQMDIASYVTFLGPLDENEMIKEYLSANVFVSASTVENESNSLSEARLLGIPCISSFVGGAYQRIEHAEEGFLYPHDEPALLAYYVCCLFENKDDICTRFSRNSTKKIMQFVDPELNAGRNLEIYNRIVREKVLTVSVASYNVEKYLRKTLDSLVCDTDIMNKMEVIIIDDGSTDDTADIALEYVRKWPDTFVLISKGNGGHGSTLNSSLKYAHGKYFKMLDGDDWLREGSVPELIKYLDNNDAEMVLTPYQIVYVDEGRVDILNRHHIDEGQTYVLGECSEGQLDTIHAHEIIFKTKILQDRNIKILENCYYVDDELSFFAILFANTMAFYNDAVYCYRIGRLGQSVSDEAIKRYWHDGVRVVEDLLDRLNCYKDTLEERKKHLLYKRLSGNTERVFSAYSLLDDPDRIIKIHHELSGYIERVNPEFYEWLFNNNCNFRFYTEIFNLKHDNHAVVLAGSGKVGKRVKKLCDGLGIRVNVFCDNDKEKWGKKEEGILVESVEEAVIKNSDSIYIICVSKNAIDISMQLQRLGVPQERMIIGEKGS